jgi:MFS family permease
MRVSEQRKWWALGALALSVLVVGLDLTVLNLALPTLATDLHASTSQLQWIVDAYSLVLAAMLLPAGLLGDRFGRKRLLLGALLVFGAASLACAYASRCRCRCCRCCSRRGSGSGRSPSRWAPPSSPTRSARSSAAGC